MLIVNWLSRCGQARPVFVLAQTDAREQPQAAKRVEFGNTSLMEYPVRSRNRTEAAPAVATRKFRETGQSDMMIP